MISMPMPFRGVPCSIWLPTYETDAYNNEVASYGEEPDIVTTCCYAPGGSRPDTSDDIEDGRPYGTSSVVTFYLPKTLDADLRGAHIACHPDDDPRIAGCVFEVVGQPYSYMRANTPGDYSWAVEGAEFLG